MDFSTGCKSLPGTFWYLGESSPPPIVPAVHTLYPRQLSKKQPRQANICCSQFFYYNVDLSTPCPAVMDSHITLQNISVLAWSNPCISLPLLYTVCCNLKKNLFKDFISYSSRRWTGAWGYFGIRQSKRANLLILCRKAGSAQHRTQRRGGRRGTFIRIINPEALWPGCALTWTSVNCTEVNQVRLGGSSIRISIAVICYF